MAYDEKLRRDVGQSTSALKEKASEHAANVASGIEDVAGKVAVQGREAGEHMHKVAGNLKAAVDKSVKDQPMATLAIASMVGFVLGALWKS
jgi:ElaB/YqjD/DUF883 family membrane-anchored ribosome-binding protein